MNTNERDATLRCTRCGTETLCWVRADAKVGDLLDTGECDGCDPFRLSEDADESAEPVRFEARIVKIEVGR